MAGVASIAGIPFSESVKKHLKNRKILFVLGGWEGHDPEGFKKLLVPWMKKEGAEVIVTRTLDSYLDEELMNSLDLIVQIYTMSTITPEQEKGLLSAVKGGVGIAGWHGGLGDAFRDNPEYQFMVGGQWVAHPGGVIDYMVRISDSDDPVTKGLHDFALHSEQYYMHVDPNVKVLATTTFNADHASWIDGCTIPVCWKKMYGDGRVFYLSIGHKIDDFSVPEALTMMQRGIIWASQSKEGKIEPWKEVMY
jgi:type 1 glutamine amidotransferase